MGPNARGWNDTFAKSDIPELREIAETLIITKSWREFDNLTKHGLFSNGTHTSLLPYWPLKYHRWGREFNHDRGFYKGEREKSIPQYSGYFTSKNWHLNEELYNLNDDFWPRKEPMKYKCCLSVCVCVRLSVWLCSAAPKQSPSTPASLRNVFGFGVVAVHLNKALKSWGTGWDLIHYEKAEDS